LGKSDPQAIAELQGSNEIKFYERGKPYYELTNFYQGTPVIAAIPSKLTEEGEVAPDSVMLTEEMV